MTGRLLIDYCYGIPAKRRLCKDLKYNLTYRWFCRISLKGEVSDHSTFSRNHHGLSRKANILRTMFDEVMRRCIEEVLICIEY